MAPLPDDLVSMLRSELDRCAKCGQCRAVCPVFQETGEEADVARGRISLVEAILEGRLHFTRGVQASLDSCLACGRCEAECPSGVGYELILHAAREGLARCVGVPFWARLVFRSLLPRKQLFRLAISAASAIRRLRASASSGVLRHPPFFLRGTGALPPLAPRTALDRHSRLSAAPRVRGVIRGRVAVFVGCLIDMFYVDIADDLAALLEHLGYEPVFPPEQVCCGEPLLNLGDTAGASQLAKINASALAKAGVDTVLTPCAACGHALKVSYGRLLGPRWMAGAFRVLDVAEFFAAADLGSVNALPLKLTYHDACLLRWGQKLLAEPRALLARCAEFVEMSEPHRCCGAGGILSIFRPDLAARIAQRKVQAILSSGAQVVASGCPGCRLMLADRLRAAGSNVETLHTVQVLRRAICPDRH